MRIKTKSLAMAGAVALGTLALSTPNAQAASKSASAKLIYNKYCTATIYVDDHTSAGKVRGQGHVSCTGGNGIVTPSIDFVRDGKHILGGSIGPRIIDKDHGFAWDEYTSDLSGTQCYKARFRITYPDPADINESQFITTPCLNT